MAEAKDTKPLTPGQKARIYAAIGASMLYNDTPCEEVIERDYGGEEEFYLRQMAIDHNVSLEDDDK